MFFFFTFLAGVVTGVYCYRLYSIQIIKYLEQCIKRKQIVKRRKSI